MKKRLQGFAAGVLAVIVLSCVPTVAKDTYETIQVKYDNIKIYMDGEEVNPKDANGNTVEPFIYNGTTYLPVRAVGNAIGKEVSWDGVEKAVYLGKKPWKFEGRYEFFSGCKTWEDAQKYCEALGGYLATITSEEENEYLYNFMVERGYKGAYFGLSDSRKEGTWEWVNGEKSAYTNWAPGEPNGQNSAEDFAMFYYKYSDGKWNDGDFSNSPIFICEWDYDMPVKASSVCIQDGYNFSAYRAFDGNVQTAWATNDKGVGEWIEFNTTGKKISGIKILNGYCVNKNNYYANSRVEDLRLWVDGNKYIDVTLDDVFNEYQEIVFNEPIYSSKIRLEVLSFYEGSKFVDVCISEIELF